jgi:hypothetical protein
VTTFASAGQASNALYEAVRKNDEKAVQSILGAGPELTSCGDESKDQIERSRFAQKYQEMHRLVRELDGSTVLYIGAENWPFPIPLVEKQGNWHFDSDAGSQEILARVIGEDEISAINVFRALSNSGQSGTDNDVRQFAQKVATSGSAAPEQQEAFRGYYFRVLAKEPSRRTLVAYPVEYGVTGVMTFIVADGGNAYEKDLGPQTATLASKIQGKPKGNWKPVQ